MIEARQAVRLFCALSLAAVSPCVAQEAASKDELAKQISGEISATRVFASDVGGADGEEEDSGSSVILRGSLDYQVERKDTQLTLSYDTAGFLYDEEELSDRWSNRGAVAVINAISDTLSLFGQASYASNFSTVESPSTDQSEILWRMRLSPDQTHRFSAFGGWRWREYDGDDSDGNGPFFGLDYRYRFNANQYLSAEVRREAIDSDGLRRGYDRNIAELFYQQPIANRVRLRTGATGRWWDFEGRFAPNGDLLKRRSLTPEIELQYAPNRPGWLLRGRLQYIARASNDPSFDKDEERALLTGGFRF